MKNWIFTLLLSSFLSCNAQTNDSPTQPPSNPELHRVSFQSSFDHTERDYYLFLPKGYHTDTLKKWPVIFHLHGNGARGNGKSDLKWVTKHGPLMEAWVQKRDLPFIIIVPQLQMMGMDTLKSYIANRDENTIPKRLLDGVPSRLKMSGLETYDTVDPKTKLTPCEYNPKEIIDSKQTLPYPKTGNIRGWNLIEEDLISILDNTLKQYRTNSKKVYLSGISYGAFGTWYLSSSYPGKFAAIVPVSGWGHPELMKSLANQNIAIQCHSGCQDKIIATKDFYPGLAALKGYGFTNYHFSIEPNAGHDIWKKVFAQEELYHWLLKQQLP